MWDETKIATALEAVQKEVGAGVAIGSYPVSVRQLHGCGAPSSCK